MQLRHTNPTNPFHSPIPAEGRELMEQDNVQEEKSSDRLTTAGPSARQGVA